jgi:hypothetical protein
MFAAKIRGKFLVKNCGCEKWEDCEHEKTTFEAEKSLMWDLRKNLTFSPQELFVANTEKNLQAVEKDFKEILEIENGFLEYKCVWAMAV